MGLYVDNVVKGIIVFPVLAVLLTMPYALFQYRKYSAVSFWKTLVFFTFVFYLLCAYFMVILPLPECTVAAECGAVSKAPQLVPFQFVGQFIDAAQAVDLSLNPRTWLAWLKQPEVYATLFNLLLTMPLGMYFRHIFKAGWVKALILGFCISLFFEVSQLTGLFGIYDYAYRLFDVDDLIVNSAGCALGSLLAIPLLWLLPDFKELGEKALVKGEKFVSFPRRVVGFVLDYTLCLVVSTVVAIFIPEQQGALAMLIIDVFITGFFFMVVPVLTHGQTIGHKAVRARMSLTDGSPATAKNYVMRYGTLVWGLFLGPNALLLLLPPTMDDISFYAIILTFLAGYAVWFATILARAIRAKFGHPFVMVSDVISDTMLSPVQIKRRDAA